MAKYIVGAKSDRLYQMLFDAGIVSEPPEEVRRVVIDLQCGSAAVLYVEKYLDDSMADVFFAGLRPIRG